MEEEDAESSDDEEQGFAELFSQAFGISEVNGDDESFRILVINSNEAVSFANQHPHELVDYIQEAFSKVETIAICPAEDDDDDDVDPILLRSACVVLGGALETLGSLREVDFDCEDLEDYTVMSVLLRFVRQISMLGVFISSALVPPTSVDLALKFHPALENLTVTFTNEDTNQVWNPFPTSLSTLPKLRELEFYGVDDSFPRLNNFRHSIRCCSSTQVRVVLQDFSLHGEDNRELAEVVASNRNLTQLAVSRCQTVIENSEMLCQQLGNHTKLNFFNFSCPEDLRFYTLVANAVKRNNVLNSLVLVCMGDKSIHGTGLTSLLARLQTDDSLEGLKLVNYSWEQNTLCQSMNGYLATTRSFRGLIISTTANASEQLTDSAWHQICTGMAANTSLNILDVNGCGLTTQGCRQGLSVLQNNIGLQELTIRIANPRLRAKGLVECIRGIEKNKGSSTLIVTSDEEEKTLLTVQQAKVVLEVLKNNYYLTSCPFDIELSEGECEDECDHILSSVHSFFKLNMYGRQYMTKQSASKEQTISLLTKVVDDYDCIFLHLRENPLLFCNIGKRQSFPPSSSRLTRRKKKKFK